MNRLWHGNHPFAVSDDLLVFVEGTKQSIEGNISVFVEFATWAELCRSLEKSMVYMACVPTKMCSSILTNFPFAEGELPVQYLGLPLITKAMTNMITCH